MPRTFRQRRGLTQAELAAKAGISRGYLARLETARQDPTLTTLERLARALGVKVTRLAERLISELSGTEFHPESYEDEYLKRLLKAIEQKVAGLEIAHVGVETPPPTTDLIATRKASLGRKALAKAAPPSSESMPGAVTRPTRRQRAS